jgi:tetratricopeptide (TPR) repeat protein
LRRRLWPADTFVDFDLSVNSAVRKLREALGDSAEHPTFIETLPRVGYRFIAPVERPQISRHDAERWVQGFIAGLDAVERLPSSLDAAEGQLSSASPLRRRPRLPWAVALGALALITLGALGWWWGLGAPRIQLSRSIAVRPLKNVAASVLSPRNRVISPEAKELYERGVTAHGALRNGDALSYFQQAVAIQTDYAEAHAALALSWVQFLYGGTQSPEEVLFKAEAAAARALVLDDTLVDAYKAVAESRSVYGDAAGADWAIDRLQTVALRGAESESLTQLSRLHLIRQRVKEAVDAAERALEFDPRWLNARIALARAHRADGRPERAITELRKALQNRDQTNVLFHLGVTYVLKGDIKAGIRELENLVERRGSNLRFKAYLGYAYARDGRKGEARTILEELLRLQELQYVSSFGIALILDALDEKTAAQAALDLAWREHAVEFIMLDAYPKFDTLVAHPRYQQLLGH